MVEINWTYEAQVWLRDIYSYIAADNPEAARRTIAGIFEKVQLLNVIPDWDIVTTQRNLTKFASSFTATTALLT